MIRVIATMLFLAALVVPVEAKNQRVLADCDGWTSSPTPADGDSCYDTTLDSWWYYDGSTWNVGPRGSTVAALPSTCTSGESRRLTDGGAKDSIVWCDGSNTWRCEDEFTKHELNPYCPPYNADATLTDGTNHTAMQALLDRAKDWTVNLKQRYWGIDMGCDVLTINSDLEFDPNPNTSTLLHIYSHCEGGMNFTGTSGAGTYGLKFAGAAGNGNIIHLDRLQITGAGGTSGPESALWLNNQVQVWITNNRIGGGTKYDLRLSGTSGHTLVQGNIFGEGSAGDADGAYIKLEGSHAEIIIDANMSEGAVEGLLSDFLQGANNYSATAFRFTNNAHRGNSIQSLVNFNYNDVTITSGIIADNTGIQIEDVGINLAGTNNSLFDTMVVSGNALVGDSTKTNTCIKVNDATNMTIADNQCKSFDKGMVLNGTLVRVGAYRNAFQDTDTTCVELNGAYSFTEIDGVDCDGAATADIDVNATSGGNNRIANIVATDGSVPILDTTSLTHVTDVLELADRVQQETCTTTLTLTPVYKKVHLAGTNACAVTMAERPGNGQDITIAVTASGGNITLADSGGVVELAGGVTWTADTVNDTLKLHYLSDTVTNWVEISRADN